MVKSSEEVRGPGRMIFGVKVTLSILNMKDDGEPFIDGVSDVWLYRPCGPRQRKWLEREVRQWAELLP